MKELLSYVKENITNPILIALGLKKNYKIENEEKLECEFKHVDEYSKHVRNVENYMLKYYGLKKYKISNEREMSGILNEFRPEDYDFKEYIMERDKVNEYVMTRDRDNRTMSQILSDFENKTPKKED